MKNNFTRDNVMVVLVGGEAREELGKYLLKAITKLFILNDMAVLVD